MGEILCETSTISIKPIGAGGRVSGSQFQSSVDTDSDTDTDPEHPFWFRPVRVSAPLIARAGSFGDELSADANVHTLALRPGQRRTVCTRRISCLGGRRHQDLAQGQAPVVAGHLGVGVDGKAPGP